jgi:hypothetical protein
MNDTPMPPRNALGGTGGLESATAQHIPGSASHRPARPFDPNREGAPALCCAEWDDGNGVIHSFGVSPLTNCVFAAWCISKDYRTERP